MTPHQTRKNSQNSTVPARTRRLRLEPKAPPSGYVDGAWWPHTDAGDAHITMMTAAQPHNAATVDGLLMISPRDRERRSEASNARERWESEGGATTWPTLAEAHG